MEPPVDTVQAGNGAVARLGCDLQGHGDDGFKSARVRVANMRWRYGPAAIESMLAFHNLGGTPEQRKQQDQRLFAIERDALREAMTGAPEILFVAGAGNEDNSADFQTCCIRAAALGWRV